MCLAKMQLSASVLWSSKQTFIYLFTTSFVSNKFVYIPIHFQVEIHTECRSSTEVNAVDFVLGRIAPSHKSHKVCVARKIGKYEFDSHWGFASDPIQIV